MSLLRGLSGFIVGAVVGGAGLTAATLYVPAINAAFEAENKASNEAMPAVENSPKPMTPTAGAKPAPQADVVVEPKTSPVVKPVVVEPAPKEDAAKTPEPETDTIVVPQKQTAKVGMKAEEPVKEPAPKKTILPKISADPAPEVKPEPEAQIEEKPVDSGITIGQKSKSSLPSIQDNAVQAEKVAQDNIETDQAGGLKFNAIDYTPTDRPMLAIILHDIGAAGLSAEQLKALNAPITIAIDPSAADASQRALSFHDAGFEVIALAASAGGAAFKNDLSEKAVTTTMDQVFSIVPHAIGLVDNLQGTLGQSSRLAKPLVKVLMQSGHGVVTLAKGLNALDREAQAAGVHAARIGRVLDGSGESKAQIGRYLDRVAVDAGRDGAVIVVATTAQETVASIAGWALGSKGQSVSLAPVSAVLLAE